MLSVERIKQLIGDPSLSDKKAEEIRDNLRFLAEIVFEKWDGERNQKIKSDVVQNSTPREVGS